MRLAVIASVVAVVAAAAPAAADPTIIRGRVTSSRTGAPVEGATVYVTGGAGTEDIVMTTRRGLYEAEARGGGTYALVVSFGTERERRRLAIEPGRDARVDVRIDTDPGEVIVIDDHLKPPPRPRPAAPRKPRRGPLPYSDAAIVRDAWAVAWLLLDVGPRGNVRRVKFLNRPGYDLEPIALREMFAMRFHPARDHADRPVRSLLIYQIEWPSYWWLVDRTGVTTGYARSHRVPCRGSGPLDLDDTHPVYRDCTPPNLKAAQTEAWIPAPDADAQR